MCVEATEIRSPGKFRTIHLSACKLSNLWETAELGVQRLTCVENAMRFLRALKGAQKARRGGVHATSRYNVS